MKQRSNDEEAVRQYLLGQLQEAEQIAIEDRFLMDEAYFERLEMIEDELIDDYVTGTLSEPERQAFSAHFLAAPERKKKLKFALAMHKYAQDHPVPRPAAGEALLHPDPEPQPVPKPGPWMRLASTPYFRIAASLLLLVGLGWITYRVFFYQSDVDKGLALLRELHSSERPVDARLTALGYAPVPSQTRGDEKVGLEFRLKHDHVASILRDALRQHPGPESEHAIGEFYLTDKDFEEAISHLQSAVGADSSNAEFHNDLGAALLEKGKTIEELAGGSSANARETLEASLGQFDEALRLKPSLLDALFNRALCHKAMKDVPSARDDWRLYIEKDPVSRWATEARESLRELERDSGDGTKKMQ